MARIQLALNVEDLDAAIAFYTTLFGTPPTKQHPGYANFAVADPPLKLVLIEGAGQPATLNHIGVEVESADDVASERARLGEAGFAPVDDDGVCCFADQSKLWVTDPSGLSWEVYAVLADVTPAEASAENAACCSLEGEQLDERRDELQDLFATSLVRADRPSDREVRLVFDGGAEAHVRAAVEKERVCCSALRFDVDVTDGAVTVAISGPESATETLDQFEALASTDAGSRST